MCPRAVRGVGPSRRPPDSAGGPGRAKLPQPSLRGMPGMPRETQDAPLTGWRPSDADLRGRARGPRRWSFSRRGCCDLRANSHLEDRFGDGELGALLGWCLRLALGHGLDEDGQVGPRQGRCRWLALGHGEDATVQRETALDAEFGVVVVRLATPTAEHDPRLPNQRRRRTRVPAKGESTGGSSRQKRGHAEDGRAPCPWPRTSSDRGPTVP